MASPEGSRRPASILREVASLREVHEVNALCLETLTREARSRRPDPLSFVTHFRAAFSAMTPSACLRAAHCAFLLMDMQFANPKWWTRAVSSPLGLEPVLPRFGALPRQSAMKLARATLMLAWHAVRADRRGAEVLIGIHTSVANILEGLSLDGVDKMVDRQYRHVRPRWEDHPSVWAQLIEVSHTEDIRRVRDFNLRGLKLIAGELFASGERMHSTIPRVHQDSRRAAKPGARVRHATGACASKLSIAVRA
jgi:hypothetical protein